ncbi:MAG: hypothetical protein QOE23_611, partial [Pseudonocardiales bacterium]|nr:hypothetical protein [Pseudonocardiales bacterium]
MSLSPLAVPTTSFPADFAPGNEPAAAAVLDPIRVPTELGTRLERISRGQDELLQVVLAAAAVALLGRYTRSDEVFLGLPGGRVLLVDPAGSLRVLLGRVTTSSQNAPSQIAPSQIAPSQEASVRGASSGPADVVAGLAVEPPLGAGVWFGTAREDGGLVLTVGYDASRYAETSIRALARQYLTLLDAATAEPDRPVAELELCTAEDTAVVAAANATEYAFGSGTTVHGLFARQAAATPDAPALVSGAGTLSYADLDARSNQLAHTLREYGVGPDVVVALLAERSSELMVGILAVLKAGGCYLPVDPSYPPARIDYLLTDSGARLVLAQARFAGLAGSTPVLALDEPASYAAKSGPVEPSSAAGDLAYLIYTSGSTGAPKGVLVEHRSVVNRLLWMQRAYPIATGDVLLQKTSTSFDVSVWELFWWAVTGATLA